MIFGPGEGLVVDEACFSDRDVDDLKGLVDLEKSRDVECRNRDGHIPKLTPNFCPPIGVEISSGPEMLSAQCTLGRSLVATCGLK